MKDRSELYRIAILPPRHAKSSWRFRKKKKGKKKKAAEWKENVRVVEIYWNMWKLLKKVDLVFFMRWNVSRQDYVKSHPVVPQSFKITLRLSSVTYLNHTCKEKYITNKQKTSSSLKKKKPQFSTSTQVSSSVFSHVFMNQNLDLTLQKGRNIRSGWQQYF